MILLLFALAEHSGEALVRLAKQRPPTVMPPAIRRQADWKASHVIVTNYNVPSPIAGPVEAESVSYRVVVNPPPTNRPAILPGFRYPPNAANLYWHLLSASDPMFLLTNSSGRIVGPCVTNAKNMRFPLLKDWPLVRTNRTGFFRMLGTVEELP